MLILLAQTLHTICHPNPSRSILTTEDYKLLVYRNKLSLFVHLAMIMIPIVLLPFTHYSRSFNMTRIGVLSLMMVIFIITCRSYRTIGQVLNTILGVLTNIYLVSQPESVYYQLSVAYVAPFFLFYITNNPYLSATAAFSHTILLIVKFKQNLLNAILFTDPELFVEKFVNGFVVTFIILETISLTVFLTLNKRTVELSYATKAAKDALEQQKTFVYSFSHEMRNPMNSLLGNLDLVLMTRLAPETRTMLKTAKTCGVLLLNHINTILDAGKMELAKLEVKPIPTKVHDVLQRIWAISQDLIAQKGLRYHLKIEKKVPALLMLDSHRLSQILLNLIGNATKFTQKGSIGVSVQWVQSPVLNDECFEPKPYDEENEGIFEKDENVSFSKMNSFDRRSSDFHILNQKHKEFDLQDVRGLQPGAPGILKIIIKDTGCGISHEEIPKLFQKFSQVGNDTSQRSMGTGLGLYISKEICKNMNGDLRVYSKLQVGTTFIVCIPVTPLPKHRQSYVPHSPAHIIEALKTKKLKIIVADDSPFNVNLVSNFCSKFGAQIIAATNDGLSAYGGYVQSIKSGISVDVVTLDIDMPIMGGKEACEKIREYERENRLKPCIILLISGNYEMQQMSSFIGERPQRKADCFIRKPLIFDEFCWNLFKTTENDF